MKRTTSAKEAQGRPLGQILDSLLLDQRLAILDQLALQLAELHEQQEWYGALGLDTVVLTDEGLVQLLPLERCMHKRSLMQARAKGMVFDEPCAAPEQYVDDPARPAGPWSDVYGFAALRWQLTTGIPLMAAPWRQLKDPVVMDEDADGPTQAMLQGLALDWMQRPQSMPSYRRLERLGQVPEPIPEQAPAAQAVLPITPERRSFLPLWLAGVAMLALVGFGAVYWGSDGDTAGSAATPPDSSRSAVAEYKPEEPLQKPEASLQGQKEVQGPGVGNESRPAEAARLGTESGSVGATGAVVGTRGGQEQAVPQTQSQSPLQSLPASQLGQPLPQGSEQQVAPKIELKLLSESGIVQSDLSGQTGASAGMEGQGNVADTASATAGVGGAASRGVSGDNETTGATERGGARGAIGATTAGNAGVAEVAAAEQTETSESSAQVDHVEQLEPVAAKPAPPAKGTIALDVRPWGEVYVNGRKQGVSPPLKSLSLAPGSHRIVIKNPGLPEFSTTIRVRSGKTASVSHEFK